MGSCRYEEKGKRSKESRLQTALGKCSHESHRRREHNGMTHTAVPEPMLVRDAEREGQNIDVRQYRSHRASDEQTFRNKITAQPKSKGERNGWM